jgi:hypothetical protein
MKQINPRMEIVRELERAIPFAGDMPYFFLGAEKCHQGAACLHHLPGGGYKCDFVTLNTDVLYQYGGRYKRRYEKNMHIPVLPEPVLYSVKFWFGQCGTCGKIYWTYKRLPDESLAFHNLLAGS